MRYRISPLILAFALILPATLFAAEAKYLTPANTPDGIQLLPAPPAPGSQEEREDAESAFRVYSSRTPEQFAKGKDENRMNVFFFASAIGPWFQATNCPKTEALFKEVEAEARAATSGVKNHFKRLRPCNAEPERFSNPIEPVKSDNNAPSFYSYPSGTTTRSTTYAFLLVELFPDKRAELLAKARESGWLRIQGGVHYPMDVYAGRVWGQALARAFLASPDFQRDFAEVRSELAAAQKKALQAAP